MKDLRDDLWSIQSTWRSRANGPQGSNPDSESYKEDFDSHTLENYEIKLPPLKFVKQASSRRTYQPLLTIRLNNVGEMFDVLLARAISNGQLSRSGPMSSSAAIGN